MMWGYGWGDGLWAVIWMVVFWGAIILLAILAFRAVTREGSGKTDRDDAKELLAQRFARGEISAEEFQERSRVLEESRT